MSKLDDFVAELSKIKVNIPLGESLMSFNLKLNNAILDYILSGEYRNEQSRKKKIKTKRRQAT